MVIFTITTPYLNNNYFGVYSSVKRARMALEHFFGEDDNIVSFEDLGDYCYHFITKRGEIFGAEIMWDIIDAEFEEGTLTDSE